MINLFLSHKNYSKGLSIFTFMQPLFSWGISSICILELVCCEKQQRISLESFRSFRGLLFRKLVIGQELFLAVSYSKPALVPSWHESLGCKSLMSCLLKLFTIIIFTSLKQISGLSSSKYLQVGVRFLSGICQKVFRQSARLVIHYAAYETENPTK